MPRQRVDICAGIMPRAGPDVFVGDDQLEALKTLKSKNELIGEIIGLLQSPAKNVISGLNAGGKLASLIKALEDRQPQEA